MNFPILQLLCFGLLLSQVSSNDCNLLLFPSVLYFSNFIQAQHSIEPYIIDEYPQASADFTHPLQLQHTFSSINSERFIEGYPFPLFVKAIEEEASVHFQMWNLTTESLQNTSIKYALPNPSQCRYFSIQQLAYNDVFIHCENATHHRQYSIEWLFREHSSIDEVKVSPNREIASKLLFYRKTVSAYRSDFRVMRSNDQGIIQLYHYTSSARPYSGYDLIEKSKDWMEKQTGLTSIEFIDYLAIDGPRGSFDTYLLRNQGILLAYGGLYYDRWNLPGQSITKILGIIDQNIVAVITNTHLYFLSVWANQRSEYRLVVKEIARIELKGISFTEGFNIGEFIILAGNQAWNVFYLKENSIKFFKFSTPLLLKDFVIDGFSIESSFLLQSQQFLLRRPQLKTNEAASSRITLRTSKCQQILTLKRLTNRQVEVVNDNADLVWRNGIIEKTHTLCQGNNISSSFFTNGQTINISKLHSFRPNLPSDTAQIMNFTMITPELTAIVTRVNFNVRILACYRNDPCQTIQTYDEIYTPKLISEARLNIFSVSLAKGQVYKEFPDLQKQLLVTVVWNMSRLYFTSYKIKSNTIYLAGGWQSFTLKFIDFEAIGYSPAKEEECSKKSDLVASLVVYNEKVMTNNWSHYTSYRNGVDITQRQDILFGFKRMCSISNSNMKFLLYEYEGNSFNIKLIYDRQIFYHEVGFASFDHLLSKRAICSRLGLAVTNGSEVFFISEDLLITRTLKLPSSTQDDKMSGSLLLHSKDASTTEIYNAETGFLIQSLHVPLDQIVVTKQSNSFALKNGTILHFDEIASIPLVKPEDFALLTCFNTNSSASKIKKIRIINDLSLPEAIQLQSWERIDKNVWNATIRSLKGVTSLSKAQNLTHFSEKVRPPRLKYFAEQNFFYRQIFGQYLEIVMLNTYCMRETGSPFYVYPLQIEYGKYFTWSAGQARPESDTTFGLSNLYQNSISIASWNESAINFMTLQFDEKNLSNVQVSFNSCPVEVWIEDEFYMTRRIVRDYNHIYLMRYEIELWNSYYNISNSWVKQYADMPRRFVVAKPKIQIFTLGEKGGCKIHEITSESLGIDEDIKDFATLVRENTTFVFILTNTQIIVFKTLNQTSRFSAKLNKNFVKIDVRFDILLLVSESDNSEVYNIIWQAFPLAGSLQLNYTLIHVQENSDIVGGVIMFYGIIIASKRNLVFYLFEERSTLYSIETKAVQDFQTFYHWTFIDAIQYKDRETILLQYYTSYLQFNTIEVTVSFSLDAENYEKLIVSNEKEHKESTRKIFGKELKARKTL